MLHLDVSMILHELMLQVANSWRILPAQLTIWHAISPPSDRYIDEILQVLVWNVSRAGSMKDRSRMDSLQDLLSWNVFGPKRHSRYPG